MLVTLKVVTLHRFCHLSGKPPYHTIPYHTLIPGSVVTMSFPVYFPSCSLLYLAKTVGTTFLGLQKCCNSICVFLQVSYIQHDRRKGSKWMNKKVRIIWKGHHFWVSIVVFWENVIKKQLKLEFWWEIKLSVFFKVSNIQHDSRNRVILSV